MTSIAHTPLGPGREFDVIRELLQHWGARARGIGDDAAVLDVPPGQHLVVSTDTSIEGVHFRSGWLTPREIGWRATTAALSDLAAMGASPLGMVLALVLPPAFLPHVGELADGIGEAAAAAGTPIVGGDTSRGDTLGVGVTVMGSAAAPVRRGGARAGDHVYVTGHLGGPGAALKAWEQGRVPLSEHRERFAHPRARIAEGQWLAAAGASAMIDVSDGLAADLRHLASASVASFEIDLSLVPAVVGVDQADAALSGEEYELVVTSPAPIDVLTFRARFDLSLTRIGSVTAGEVPALRCVRDGVVVDLGSGYEHF